MPLYDFVYFLLWAHKWDHTWSMALGPAFSLSHWSWGMPPECWAHSGNHSSELRARRWGASTLPWVRAVAQRGFRKTEGFLEVVSSEQITGRGRHWNKRDQSVLEADELDVHSCPAASSRGFLFLSLWSVSRRNRPKERGHLLGWQKMDLWGLPFCCSGAAEADPSRWLLGVSLIGPCLEGQALPNVCGWRVRMSPA